MERDIGPLLDEFLKPWNGVLCFHFVPVCLYVCRYTGYRALTLTKDPNFPLDGTLRHTKETHFFSFVEMSVSTRDFCFRFPPIVTLVNFVFQTTGHVFFYNEEKYCLIYCRNNKRTSITVLLSKVTRRTVDKVTRVGQVWSSDYMLSGLLHWHCCDTRCH